MSSKLQINLSNLEHNIKQIKRKMFNTQELLVMVKADAYGAGLIQISKYLEKLNINHLGVAYLKEAKELINSGIQSNITVFSGILEEEIKDAVSLGAIYSISNINTARLLDEEAKSQNKKVKVQLAIDTGMTRLGISVTDIDNVIKELKCLDRIIIEGVYTHLSCADTDEKFTKRQLKVFDKCIDDIKKMGVEPKYIHACNSAGFLLYNSENYNMIRIGICAYGYLPKENLRNIIDLKGILKLETQICNIREVNKGIPISYGATYITDSPKKIAVIQIGYADGLSRMLSNKYELMIKDKKVKIIGNICMDTCMIDITDMDVNITDKVIVFDFGDMNVEKIAKTTGTINYEVLTNIGKRVERSYI